MCAVSATVCPPLWQCGEFRGENDYRLPVAMKSGVSALTISLWVYANSTFNQTILDLEFADGGLLQLKFGKLGSFEYNNKWTHVVWLFIQNNIYVFANAKQTTSTMDNPNYMADLSSVAVNPSFVGFLASLRGWNRPLLVETEMLSLFNNKMICLDCDTFFVSEQGSSECVCDHEDVANNIFQYDTSCGCRQGYTEEDGVCVPCPAGYYCPPEAEMQKCPELTSSDPGAQSIADCWCQNGLYDHGGACVVCPENSYCVQSVVYECIPGAISTANSSASTDCACALGEGFENGACESCAVGTFSNEFSLNPCEPCETGDSSTAGAFACNFCDAGYAGLGGGCTLCPLGTYCPLHSRHPTSCPSGTFGVKSGAATVQEGCACQSGIGVYPDCECLVGAVASYCECTAGTFEASGVCEACYEGFWCPGGAQLVKCSGEGQTSPVASTDASDCVCDKGLFYYGGECVNCTFNHFKDVIGNQQCTVCPQYSITVSTGADAVDDCICSDGYFSVEGWPMCYACGAGFYCQDNVQSACPPFSTTLTYTAASLSDCLCLEGYYYSSQMSGCMPCGHGSYKASKGNQACDMCPPNTVNLLTAQTSEDACTSCPFASMHTTGGVTDVTLCEICPAGYYESVLPDSETRVCLPCGEHMTSASRSTSFAECSCAAGYYMQDSACIPCGEGSFKSGVGNEACTSCGAGTFAASEGSTSCQRCPYGTYSSMLGATAVSNCTFCPANSWHYKSGQVTSSPCTCNPGFLSNASTGACEPCTDDSYFCENNAAVSCPVHSVSLYPRAKKEDCVCQAGYYLYYEHCIACSPNTYKAGVSNFPCASCPDNSVSTTRGAVTVDECLCAPGFEKVGGLCVACDVGYFSDAYGNGACAQCHPNSTTLHTETKSSAQCRCVAGYWESAPNSCSLCPVGYFCSFGDVPTECPSRMTTESRGATTSDSCICVPGTLLWETPNWQSCELCEKNHYCTGSSDDPRPCPDGLITLPDNTNDNIDYCLCPSNTFKVGADCLPCPENTTSKAGSFDIQNCTCAFGFGPGPTASGCASCPDNTFWNEGCFACPENTTSVAGVYECNCVDGMRRDANGGCMPCGQDELCVLGHVTRQCALPQAIDSSTGRCECKAGHFTEETCVCLPGQLNTAGECTCMAPPQPCSECAGTTICQHVSSELSIMCVLSDHASPDLTCWGLNDEGILDNGAMQSRPGPVVLPLPNGTLPVNVRMGDEHMCIHLNDMTIKCLGPNGNGEAGEGASVNETDGGPRLDSSSATRVLAGAPFMLGSLTMGPQHACAIPSGARATVFCWGSNQYSVLTFAEDHAPMTKSFVALEDEVAFLLAGTKATFALVGPRRVFSWGTKATLGDYNSAGYYVYDAKYDVREIHVVGMDSYCLRFVNTLFFCWDEYSALSGGGQYTKLTPPEHAEKNVLLVANGWAGPEAWGALSVYMDSHQFRRMVVDVFNTTSRLLSAQWVSDSEFDAYNEGARSVDEIVMYDPLNPVVDILVFNSEIFLVREKGDWVAVTPSTTYVPASLRKEAPCAHKTTHNVCEICPLGHFCHGGAGKMPCPLRNQTTRNAGSTSIDECVCETGFTLSALETCDKCAVGAYKDSPGNHSCVDCPQSRFTAGTGATSVEDCLCGGGHFEFSTEQANWISYEHKHVFEVDGHLQNWACYSGRCVFDNASSSVEILADLKTTAVFSKSIFADPL